MTLKAIGINVQGDKLFFCALAKYHICNKFSIELQCLFYFNGNERWLQYLINSMKYFKVGFSPCTLIHMTFNGIQLYFT